ncbi:MAG: PD-(D/E)XK nuclease family protein [Gloeomargaritaceae cyanobacterium C42_A2020_066]|nr:PD-(D/E)XK nuclease family protein [Gloeomargaritaceae cyanobacterium C42_A2020_066]
MPPERTVFLDLWSDLKPPDPAKYRVITPARAAAWHLFGVPALKLETLAMEVLERQTEVRRVSRLRADRYLQTAVAEVLAPRDGVGTTRTLALPVRELLRQGVDLDRLQALGSPRTQQLAAVTRRYQQLLQAENLIDRAEVFWAAGRLGVQPQPLLVVGYPFLGPDQQAFLDQAAGPESLLILPWRAQDWRFQENEQTARFLMSRGWQVRTHRSQPTYLGAQLAACWVGEGKRPAAVVAHSYPHQEAEVRGVLTQVKALLSQGVTPHQVALVVRDEAVYAPLVLAVAAEYQVPLCTKHQIPVGQTRVGHWLLSLVEMIASDGSFEATSRFYRHSLSQILADDRWCQVRQERPSTWEAWAKLGLAWAGPTRTAHQSRRAWIDWLQEKLTSCEGLLKQTLRQAPDTAGRWGGESQALLLLSRSLGALATPAEEVLSFGQLASELRDVLDLLQVGTQPGHAGIELHSPPFLFGARCPHVFILGMAEGVFPQPSSDTPWLDSYEAKRLAAAGLPCGTGNQAPREALSFWSLLKVATQSLTLTYPVRLADRECLPSPFLADLGLKPQPAPPRPAASLEEMRQVYLRRPAGPVADAVLSLARQAWAVEWGRESSQPPDEYDGIPGLPLDPLERTFSASQLTQIGQCPFRWWVGYGLGVREVEEPEEGLDATTRGTLYHKVLELALQATGPALNREAILAALDSSLTAAEQALAEDARHPVHLDQLPQWVAQRPDHVRSLALAVRGEEFLQPGASVAGLETEFRGEWHGLAVMGFVDRIDRTPAGLVFIDYKTSSKAPTGAQDAQGKARLDVQLPLYMQAAAPALFPGEPVAGAYYYSLLRGKKLKVAEVDPAGLSALAQRVKTHLQTGSYPVAPDVAEEACTYCAYDSLCRKGPRLQRKSRPAPSP